MIEHSKESFYLELAEIIKVNQLVRDRIRVKEFEEWYQILSAPQQLTLTTALFEFAHQAGVDEYIWDESLLLTNFQSDNKLVGALKSFHNDELGLHFWSNYNRWTKELTEAERFDVFKIVVYLFGTAEGSVFAKENKLCCNHWWHRDLLDNRIVESILNDKFYYKTSMKDDDKIKAPDELTKQTIWGDFSANR